MGENEIFSLLIGAEKEIVVINKNTRKTVILQSLFQKYSHNRYSEASYYLSELEKTICEKEQFYNFFKDDKIYSIKEHEILFFNRILSNDTIVPCQLEIYVFNEHIVITIKEGSEKTILMHEAISMIEKCYFKIIKANLSTCKFKQIKFYDTEMPVTDSIYDWVKATSENYVFPLDRENFINFFDKDFLIESFLDYNVSIKSLCYRRIYNGEWCNARAIVMPCADFSEENPNVMIFVGKI